MIWSSCDDRASTPRSLRSLHIADVDDDGMPEIVVGRDILSDVSTCRILTHERRVKAELPVEGWTSCLTALAWGSVNQRPLLACGATRGRNLHLYDLGDIGPDRVGHPRHLFEGRLGGTVTGLGLDSAAAALVVGTSQGLLLCYELDRSLRWCRLLAEAIVLARACEGRLAGDLLDLDAHAIPVSGSPSVPLENP